MSTSLTAFPRGALVGAVLMYFLDPRRGRARRSRVLDQVTHLRRQSRRLFGGAAADAQHRVHGIVERIKAPQSEDVNDQVLEARVRTQLGRVVEHTAALEVRVRDGSVELRGPILEHEVERAVKTTRGVRGVREVIDLLDRHATRDIPSLQGEVQRRDPTLWTPAAQGLAVVGGIGLAMIGLARRGLIGTAGLIGGGVLALRGAFNEPVSQLARRAIGREGLVLEKTIHVQAPIERVFRLWRDVQNFPRFMQHVKRIDIDERDPMRSHWTVDGPAGRPVSFDAVVTHIEQPFEISWTTVPDQIIAHTGTVRFSATPDGTRVHLSMSYRPPGGAIGNAVAHLLGSDPKTRIDDDLVRMKGLLESGRTRAHGERVTRQDLVH